MASEQLAAPFSTSMITGTLTAVRVVPQVARGGASWVGGGGPEARGGPPCGPGEAPHPVTSKASPAAANRERRIGSPFRDPNHAAIRPGRQRRLPVVVPLR